MTDFGADPDFVSYRARTLNGHGEQAGELAKTSGYIGDAVEQELRKTPRRDPFYEPTANLYEAAENFRATLEQYGSIIRGQADDTTSTSIVLNDTNDEASHGRR